MKSRLVPPQLNGKAPLLPASTWDMYGSCIYRIGEYPAEEGRDGLVGINPVTERFLVTGATSGNLYGHSEAVKPLVPNRSGATSKFESLRDGDV